jgi:hypothetical protein
MFHVKPRNFGETFHVKQVSVLLNRIRMFHVKQSLTILLNQAVIG